MTLSARAVHAFLQSTMLADMANTPCAGNVRRDTMTVTAWSMQSIIADMANTPSSAGHVRRDAVTVTWSLPSSHREGQTWVKHIAHLFWWLSDIILCVYYGSSRR